MTETETPRPGSVTCVVVCYNHARFVEQCLDSAFAQTYDDLRVIVFDDASPDNSQQVIRDYLTRTGHEDVTFVAHTENRGLCATLNEALELVGTEFMTFIAADDWLEPSSVALQVAAFAAASDRTSVVYGDARLVDSKGVDTGRQFLSEWARLDDPPSGRILSDLVAVNFVLPAATMLRTRAIREVGGFNEHLLTEDFDLFIRLARTHEFIYLDERLANYRQTSGSLTEHVFTRNRDLARSEQILSLRKALGVTKAIDQAVVDKVHRITLYRYLDKASPQLLVEDQTLVARTRPRPKTVAYLLIYALRIPPSAAGALRRWLEALRERLPS